MTKIEEFEKELVENGIFAEDYRVQRILDKHRAQDTLKCTPECRAFLKNVRL